MKKIENFFDNLSKSKQISNRIEIKMRSVKEYRMRLGDAKVDAIAKKTRKYKK